MSINLEYIKSLYSKGMQYAIDTYPKGLFMKYDDLCKYQLSLANKCKDLTTFGNIISISNPVFKTAFNGPKNVCQGCEIQYNPFQFGVGNAEWYFCYGVSNSGSSNYCFEITFSKNEMVPPEVLKREGLDQTKYVLWSINGGYGIVGGEWYEIPNETIMMNYEQTSYSSFQISTINNGIDNNVIKSCIFGNTNNPMIYEFSLSFIDKDNKIRKISSIMSSNTPPSPNAENSCGNCNNNMGSLYYSYTDMNVYMEINNEKVSGKGWIDHQLLKSGIPKSLIAQAEVSVINTLIKPISSGWLWFAIQDYESNIQYMFCHFFNNKFYKDDIQKNINIPMHIVNVYQKGISTLNNSTNISNTKVILTKTINLNGIDLPSEYNIILPNGKEVILKLASSPNQYPTPYSQYENPALVINSKTNNIIGFGIIEANGSMTNDEYAKRYIEASGGDPNDNTAIKLVSDGLSPHFKQTNFSVFLAFVIFLIPLWILLLSSTFIFYKKEERGKRIIMIIILLFIIYNLSII